jgi:hypothetical protein
MINSITNKVYCITTLGSDRVDFIKSHLKDLSIDFDFYVAPETSILSNDIKIKDSGVSECRPALSLLSSYISLIESSKINGYKSIAIIEDDCFFMDGWETKLDLFLKHLPEEWNLINLGYHPLNVNCDKLQINKFVSIPIQKHFATHCMVIQSTCFDEFIRTTKNFNYTIPADYVFIELYKNQSLKSYIPEEKICIQLSHRVEHDMFDETLSYRKYKSLIVP